MTNKDINLHVRAKGVDQAREQLEGLAGSTEKVGNAVTQGGRKSGDAKTGFDALSGAAEKTNSSFLKMFGGMTGWIASMVSFVSVFRLLTSVVKANRDALQEHADIAERHQQRLSRLQYLGGFFKENPDLRNEVAAFSEAGGRPFEEVADAWYNLRSKSGVLSSQQQNRILTEALELGRTDTKIPLDTLVDMFTLYAKKSGERDANRIQNVLLQSITEAGGGGSDVAKYMPQFLPIGMAGGLSAPAAAGLWSYATTQSASPSVATTGLRSVFLGLEGRGTPESQRLLQTMGVRPDADFFSKISALSAQFNMGRFGLAQAQAIAGDSGADVLLSILGDPSAMFGAIERVSAVDRPDLDITREHIEGLLGSDEFARLEEEIRQRRIAIENQKGGDLKSLRWRSYLLETEHRMREAGSPEWDISFRKWAEGLFMGAGSLEPGQFQEINRGAIERGFDFAPSGGAVINHYHNNTIFNRSEGQATPRIDN